AGNADPHLPVPLVLDRNLHRGPVGEDLDLLAAPVDLRRIAGRALVRGVEDVARADVPVAPVPAPVAAEIVDRDEGSDPRDHADRDVKRDVLARAAFVLDDLDLEAAQALDVAGRAPPDRDPDGDHDQNEQAQHDRADFFHRRLSTFSKRSVRGIVPSPVWYFAYGYASFHYGNVHRLRGLRDQVPHAHDHGRQEREVRHPRRPVHRLLRLRPLLPRLLHPGPEGGARREGQAPRHPQGDRGPRPVHRMRVLHRHLPLRLHLPDRGPAPGDLPQDRRGGGGAVRLLPALRDRLREGRDLRPQPDHPGAEGPARPVAEEPRPGPPPDPSGTDPDEPPPKASAVRFFVLPLLVVAFAVGIFLVFNLMTFDRRSPSEYLQEVRGGGPNRRWQAAFELSRSINRV